MLVDFALVGRRQRRLITMDTIHEVPPAPRILTEAPPSGRCQSRYCEALAPLRRRSWSWANLSADQIH